MKQGRILIVGAGFSGATIARLLAEQGFTIDVIDRRDHVAGNAFDYTNEEGIRVHKYGPHIFHTSNKLVVNFLSRFTEWSTYHHRVKGMLQDGRLVTLPVNRETTRIVGEKNVLDIFYRPYTRKMWGLEIEDIDPTVLSRVEVRRDDNELYFPDDRFQAMPGGGYTKLIQEMLSHKKIRVFLSTVFHKDLELDYTHIFSSMAIDEYFDYEYGDLPYRSIRFHTATLPAPKIFPVAVVNFTHSAKFTRITEWKNFPGHGENPAATTLTWEEPCDYRDNHMERYYPVKDITQANKKRYKKYTELTPKRVTFIGRCGLYAYLDMHQAVSTATAISKKFLATAS